MLRLSEGWLKVDWYEYPPRAHVSLQPEFLPLYCVNVVYTDSDSSNSFTCVEPSVNMKVCCVLWNMTSLWILIHSVCITLLSTVTCESSNL